MPSIKSPSISEHENTINPQEATADQDRFFLLTGEKAMTLKSWNTRYMKLIRKSVLFVASLLLAAFSLLGPTRWCAEARGFNGRPVEADNSIPALQGPAAITYLKEHKLYDSLRDALHAARLQRGDKSVLTSKSIDEQKLTASDGAFNDIFGDAVAMSGSTIVVGARGDDNLKGSAYVFERHGRSWVETQKLIASDGATNDQFSDSIAFSGSTIVVGAPIATIGGNVGQGAAYVFERHGGSWVETQKLFASDGFVFDVFGKSVAVSGSTIVAGAANRAAYVFERQGGRWIKTQKLTASDAAADDFFALSVAVSGSIIVVGAPFDDIGSNLSQGSAHVFERQDGSWVETQKLTASDAAENDLFFGISVAVSGSTIVVGESFDTVGGSLFQGAAYVFDRQDESWIETQKLIASDAAPGDLFGSSVVVRGSTIIVGAPDNLGAAYVFDRHGGSWVETRKLTASTGKGGESFGISVAVSGSTAVVGAPSTDIAGTIFQGAAYVFEH